MAYSGREGERLRAQVRDGLETERESTHSQFTALLFFFSVALNPVVCVCVCVCVLVCVCVCVCVLWCVCCGAGVVGVVVGVVWLGVCVCVCVGGLLVQTVCCWDPMG